MGRRSNGLGTITKIGNKKYRMKKQIGVFPDGKRRVITVTGTSESDCVKKMKKKEEETPRYRWLSEPDFGKLTLTELCLQHLEEHLSERDRLKPKAADRRECTIRNQIERYSIGERQIQGIDSQDINLHMEQLIREGKLSVSSVEKTFDVINSAFKWAISQSKLQVNPCDAVRDKLKNRFKNLKRRNISDGVVVILSDEQIELIKKYVESLKEKGGYQYMMGMGVLILLYTGMRIGELCAMRWRDWSRESGTLDINKTRNIIKNRGKGDVTYIANENQVKNYHARTIAVDDETKAVLEELLRISKKTGEEDYILLNRSKTPTNPSNFSHNVKVFYEKIGLPDDVSGAHVLRRTCATKMHNEGCRVEDIAAYLGDTPETIMKHYISVTSKIISGGKVLNVVQIPKRTNFTKSDNETE